MVLWNGSEPDRPTRGFENTVLSYSTDGGLTFSGSDTFTWMNRSESTANPNGHLPEVQMLDTPIPNVTHVRMVVDNFSDGGSDQIVAADEIRFLGRGRDMPTVANLAGHTVNDQFDRRQGIEGSRALDLTVTLSSRNFTGAPITFDLEDLGTGTATVGVDYQPIPDGAKITVPVGAISGSFRVDVFDDALIEPTETVNARISNSSDSSSVIGQATTVATIRDNDVAGITLIGADNLQISESGQTDSYTVQLDTIPTGAVEITATADAETEISTDGVNFAATQVLSFTDTTPQTITVRAINDRVIEGTHQATITHAITGTVLDPNYPDVKVEDLYTQTGDDPLTFQDLLDSGALPRGFNSTGGVLGSAIDVNNAVFEQGVNAGIPIPQNIRLHTLGNSQIDRRDFDKWTRWYQEDGNTQIYRVFEGEENTHSDRLLAARTETHTSNIFSHGVWNEFSASYMIMKPETMSIFQSFQGGFEWSVHIQMEADGSVSMSHRRVGDDIHVKVPLGVDMIGKRFDVLIRDNGYDYEVYFNGELMGTGFWQRDPTSNFSFRWGPYVGGEPVTRDTLLFVTGVTMRMDTSDPVGLVPYRPATTSLSIASASAEILDNEAAASIVDRGVAYRGATAAYGENTIDPTKSALRGSGAAASVANYTNYTQGLNRVVIDIDDMTATELSASDFEFRVGNSEDFSNEEAWTSMPPSAINVTPLSGSTQRVTIDWPNKAIVNQWLEVTVKANANTELAQDDVFYFGNQIGDVDGSTSAITNRVTVNAFDTLDVRFNQSPTSNSVGIGHVYDVDRSGSVNAFDALDVRFHQMPSGGLMMITLPTAPAAALVTTGDAIAFQQNPDNAMDVNGDGLVTALDALIGINLLGQPNASSGQIAMGEGLSSARHFYDVNGDGMVTALDSLIVINKLGSSSNQQAERVSIPLLDLESDRDNEFDWAEDKAVAPEAAIDLAISDW